MNNPFEDAAGQGRVRNLLDKMAQMRTDIDSFREWLAPRIDEENSHPTGECSCVRDEVFELDTLLFSIDKILYLVGSGLVTHCTAIDNHERGRALRDQKQSVQGLPSSLSEGTTSIIAVPLPVDLDDEGPGPDGVH